MNFLKTIFAKDPYETDFSHAGHSFFLVLIAAILGWALWSIVRIFLH